MPCVLKLLWATRPKKIKIVRNDDLYKEAAVKPLPMFNKKMSMDDVAAPPTVFVESVIVGAVILVSILIMASKDAPVVELTPTPDVV